MLLYILIIFLLALSVIIVFLAIPQIKKRNLGKPLLIFMMVVGIGILLFIYNPVKMGLVGFSSYGLPGPCRKTAERTDEWKVVGRNSGNVSLMSQKIWSKEDTDINATVSFKIDTVFVRPRINIQIRKFRALKDADEHMVFFQDGKKLVQAMAEYSELEAPEYDKTTMAVIKHLEKHRPLWELNPTQLARLSEIHNYLDNRWLDIYGKDALRIIRMFRNSEKDVTMTVVGEDGESAVFTFDVKGFNEAYGIFLQSVKSYEKNSHPAADMPVHQKLCRKLGIYF